MGKYTKPAGNKNNTKYLLIGMAALVILAVVAISINSTQLINNQIEPTRSLAGPLVDVHTASQLREDGIFTLDVRTVEEWQAGHLPGAILIPLDELQTRAGDLPNDKPILIYCRSGNRSLQALNLLTESGFTDLYSMDGGINDWIAAGYEVEVGE